MKKGQVTFFVIIGLMIVAVFAAVYLVDFDQPSNQFSNLEELDKALLSNINECLQLTASEALELIAVSGALQPNPAFSIDNHPIQNALQTPATILQTQTDIENHLNQNIGACLDVIVEDFRQRGAVITAQTPTATVELLEREVATRLNYPIEFAYDAASTADRTQSRTAREFLATFPIQLTRQITVQQKIVQEATNNPNTINLTYLDQLPFETTILQQENGSIIILEDSNSLLNNKPYIYTFALME